MLVEIHPLVHLAEFDVAHAVVDLGEEPALAGCHDGRHRDVAGQVATRVSGTLHQRVPGIAIRGDGGHDDLAVLIFEQVRRLQAEGTVGYRVVVGFVCRADLKRQVDNPVTVRSDLASQPGSGPGRAAEDEPRAA
jgi:hypothetical protein